MTSCHIRVHARIPWRAATHCWAPPESPSQSVWEFAWLVVPRWVMLMLPGRDTGDSERTDLRENSRKPARLREPRGSSEILGVKAEPLEHFGVTRCISNPLTEVCGPGRVTGR